MTQGVPCRIMVSKLSNFTAYKTQTTMKTVTCTTATRQVHPATRSVPCQPSFFSLLVSATTCTRNSHDTHCTHLNVHDVRQCL